ncbi:hypothetical protein BKA67DRAFT_559633 [Truncatella angustata]|uniref:Uncharacterized protein n=1 Tax=Truncatella angustata TaxID=152316 RepID=A0A9P8UMX8_9PEZI|nr:uncharacterized protein BKA67DRAFT_559633 [Truncatella angustata]KAH6655158.1 hypothetical protein BKA67DRAFT_559633 [Truncatella angustata]
MPQQFAFVATDDFARIRSAERQLIRRHCMRQKNKQPDSRRSKREAARASAKSPRNHLNQDERSSLRPEPIPIEALVVSHSEECTMRGQKQVSNHDQIAPPLPSDWALFEFPEKLDVVSQKLMHQYYLRNPIRDILYPFNYFGILIDFHMDTSWCFRTLCSEQLYLRAILLLSSASNDLVLQQPLSTTTYTFLRYTIPVLNNRLSDKDEFKHDLVLYVVSILASIAILFGDFNAAKLHATGLSEVIRLRGGFGEVDYNPLIQFSVDRLNFSSLLATKLWTPLYNASIWKVPIFTAEVANSHRLEGMLCVDGLVEADVAHVFRNLQYTTILFNKHYYEKTPMEGRFIRQCLGNIHSTIVELEGRLTTEISKCLRLGMMAFLATTFRLPGLCEQRYCKSLANELQVSYAACIASIPDVDKRIEIWLLLMLLLSVSDTDKPQIWASWKATSVNKPSWIEIRNSLKQVMWIDSFHDDLGRKAVEALKANSYSGLKNAIF